MSSWALVEGPNGVLAAWETAGQVYFGRVDPRTGRIGPAVAAPGEAGSRKHPALAVNPDGEVLLAWTEGTAWRRGGHLAWQRFDRSGKPIGELGRLPDGVPVWGVPAAYARPDGAFVLAH
ncbi:MAG: hypothetical protein ACK47B_03195 [Armatimonadota bacterium]